MFLVIVVPTLNKMPSYFFYLILHYDPSSSIATPVTTTKCSPHYTQVTLTPIFALGIGLTELSVVHPILSACRRV